MMAVEFPRPARSGGRSATSPSAIGSGSASGLAGVHVADKMPDNSFYPNLTWRRDPLEAKLIAGGEKRHDLLRGGIMACGMQPDPRPSR